MTRNPAYYTVKYIKLCAGRPVKISLFWHSIRIVYKSENPDKNSIHLKEERHMRYRDMHFVSPQWLHRLKQLIFKMLRLTVRKILNEINSISIYCILIISVFIMFSTA